MLRTLTLKSLLVIAVVWGFGAQSFGQCPLPTNNFPNFCCFDLTPSGIGDTAWSSATWGGDWHHVQVDSGKTYVVSLCETVYIPTSGGFSGPNDVNFDPQMSLVHDTVGSGPMFIAPSGDFVGYADNTCGNAGNMPEIQYTATFTGNLAIIVDAVSASPGSSFGCDSFAVDSAVVFVTEIPTPSTSCDPVTGLTATKIGIDSARILWDTVPGATRYRIWYKAAGAGSWTKVVKNGQQGKKDIEGLMPGTTYRVRIQARCGSVWSALSPAISFGTEDPLCNVTVSGLSAAPVTSNKARLQWTKTSGTWKYKLRWRQMGDTAWNCVTKDSVWAKHWLINLDSATTYEWQIRALCKNGPSIQNGVWSPLQSFTTATSKTDGFSVMESSATEHVHVYPNPNNGLFTVELDEASTTSTVQLFDLTGRMVQQHRLTATNRLQINLDNNATGTYILHVTNSETQYTTRVVVR